MRLPRWKKEQKERHRHKILPLLKLSFLLIFLSGASLTGFFLVRELRSLRLPQDGRATIVLATEPILVVSFEPQGELAILSIPEKTFIEVTRGFGSYRIGAVWELGEQEKLGGELLAETTQEFLGVPVDGWIGMADGRRQTADNKENILALKNNLTSFKIFLRPRELFETLKNLRTNLTVFDLARVWLRVKNTRFDKIGFLDLGQTAAVSSLILADGSVVLTADQALVDATCLGSFKDTRITNEHILIEVLNGTDKPGLANRVTRVITNLGGHVINVANSPEGLRECQIKGESQFLKSFTGLRLGQVLKCKMVPLKPQDLRSDLQIIIGEDYWRRLFQK